MKNILVSLSIFLIYSCSNRTEIKTYYPSGALEAQYYVSKKDNSLFDGTYKSYYQNGQIKEQANYKNGVIDGTRVLFYEDGKKMIVEQYNNGNFHGEYVSYHPSGNIQSKGIYDDNVMIGMWDFYYDTTAALIKESVTFADNVENGPFTEYYKNGQIAATGSYLNELEHGLTIVYDENGDTLKRIEYDNGRPISYKEYNKE